MKYELKALAWMMMDISKLILKILDWGKCAILKVLEVRYIKVKRKTFWGKHHNQKRRDHIDITE